MGGRRSSLLAGVITGVRFATKSLEPSLMKRSAIDQGLIMGGSFLTGFLSALIPARLLSFLRLPGSSTAIRAVGVAAAAGRSAHLLGEEDDEDVTIPDEGESWAEAGSEVVSALALSGIGTDDRPPIASTATLMAVGAGTALEARVALERRPDNPDPTYIATATGVAIGLNAVVGGLVTGVLFTSRAVGRRSSRHLPIQLLVGAGTAAAITAGIGAAGKTALAQVLGKIAAGNRATEVSYTRIPESAAVSGSQYSLAAYDTLGLQGRRLVSEYTPQSDIESIMGEPPRAEPVRVYVGLGTAADEDERVEIAIQELRRAGGFDRSTIIAASPAGTGYVNYIAVEAAELMSRGDVATVAVQYGEVPSMLSLTKVGEAARLYAKVVQRLRAEIDASGKDIRLAAYGESLGSITCQIGVLRASDSLDALIVDDALWVGTPQGSVLFTELTNRGVPVFDHPDDLAAYLDAGGEEPPVYFLNHDNDPVTKMHPNIAYAMPEWLKREPRGRNMEPNQRWIPGVSFWQTLIDTKNAATVIPGEFFSTGHDYRADLGEFVRAAYGFDDVSDEQMAAIEKRLRESEISRAERIAEGKIPADGA